MPPHAIDRVLIMPRWSGTAASDFYPWLTREIASRAPQVRVEVASLRPVPDRPEIAACLEELTGLDPSRTLLLGHSVGCQVLLRALARLDAGSRAPALLCVAGWWTVDRPWDAILPWIETPFDHARTAARCASIEVLLSDNDPFTRDGEATRRRFVEALGAHVQIVPARAHFNATEEPAVRDTILRLLGG